MNYSHKLYRFLFLSDGAICMFDNIINSYNLSMPTEKTKWIALHGKEPMRRKIVLNNCVIKQVKSLIIYDVIWVIITNMI